MSSLETPPLAPHLDHLTHTIDTLTDALDPLVSTSLHNISSTLPLLDKAKLYIHLSYAIESLLYSSLLTAGLDAKSHPVFAELSRLRAYFKKVEVAEKGPEKPSLKLDKGAAGRFIRAGLRGNERVDAEREKRRTGGDRKSTRLNSSHWE